MKTIPHYPLANLPTPIEPLRNLSRQLGCSIFIKRDDLTGLAFGGNKTRKLSYLIADAQAKNATVLITTGAVQSNHCRQTAAAAAQAGLKCVLVLTGEKPDLLSGNLYLDSLLGSKILWTTKEKREDFIVEVFHQLEKDGEKPYLIPYGGSNHLGAAAYAFAMEELLAQGCHSQWIVIATSSGGTQAGLVVGARHFGYGGKILGISVDEKAEVLKPKIADLASQTAAFLGLHLEFSDEEILINDKFLGGGYGVMGNVEKEAILKFARQDGIFLDPVYTGRAAAGMLHLVQEGFFGKNQPILFWHTGGLPALFAEPYRNNLIS